MPTDTSPFEAECRAAIDEVRAALRELYSSVGANIEAPQEVSRRFGVNKTLAWNVSRILTASDPLTSVPSLPGSSAFSILLDSIAKKGAEASTLKRARDAVKLLDQTVSRHVGDRATLELIIDGLTPERGDHLAVSRKLAYRGNSGLLGIQAKARLMTVFMAPNAERPDQIDFAVIRGLIGLRRLRSSVQWPIFQLRAWGHGQAVSLQGNWHSLDVTGPGGASSPLMHNFSNIADSDVQIRHLASGTNVLLAPGPVGNTAAVDCFVGDCVRSGASKYRSELDSTGEFGATITFAGNIAGRTRTLPLAIYLELERDQEAAIALSLVLLVVSLVVLVSLRDRWLTRA